MVFELNESRSKLSAMRILSCFISACQKTSFVLVYAGLIVIVVPSVLCKTGPPNHLSYDKIYNNSHYAQLQVLSRPYPQIPSNYYRNSNSNRHFHVNRDSQSNDTEANEVDTTRYKDDKDAPLLVGFARDPFRYSIPEEDYFKGVRNIDPEVYMSKNENRGKRGVFHLYNMMYCATGCDPLAYKGYGCYCGFLGSGRPTDGIDRCCKLHDECYENIYCPFYTVYLQPYYWKCYRGQPLCALENFDTQHQLINGCAGRLCECDRQFAMCVRRYRCPRKRALCRSSPIRLLQNLLMFR
ncbi:unnamed protein product [Chrysodeixis includens]|uniref:Phospholipase A2 n=1 Tax=Chrysodeixis includens TaxID=689277 RepID=A0A9P0BMM7_CHRIL|nr:unnamed protein product [Chrysodeixis includens]